MILYRSQRRLQKCQRLCLTYPPIQPGSICHSFEAVLLEIFALMVLAESQQTGPAEQHIPVELSLPSMSSWDWTTIVIKKVLFHR